MKSLIRKIIFSAFIISLTAGPAFSIIEIGAEGTYGGYTLTNKDSSLGEKELKFSGTGAAAYLHLTYGIPKLLTIGLGPSLDLAWLGYNGAIEGITTFASVRVAFEIMVGLDIVPYADPFVRIGYGVEFDGYDQEFSVFPGNPIPITMYGGSLHVNAGLIIPLISVLRLTIEGGIVSGSLTTEATDPTGTAPQAVLDEIDKYTKSEFQHSGWHIGLGLQISI
ncbi:MAG: hypothetical protein OEZ13_03250 [Spirochaetia bacterium]|nr:hypothetical protein [Spirochaetia bacterium]